MYFSRSETSRRPAVHWEDTARIFCMISLPGNRVITGGSTDGAVVLWDARTGGREHVLTGHTDSVLALAVIPSKKQLFTAGADSTIFLWDLETLQHTMLFEGHKGFVTTLYAFENEDGFSMLYSGGDDRALREWNTAGGMCIHSFKGHKGPINTITGTQAHVFSGGSDGLVKIWDIFTYDCLRTLEGHTDSVWALCVAGDGRLISGCADGSIRVWQNPIEDISLIAELNAHRGKIRRIICFGPIMFSGSADTTVNVWNLSSGSLVETLRIHEKQVSGLTLENNQLCSCGFDGIVARWDVRELLVNKQPIVPYEPLSSLMAKEAEVAREKAAEGNVLRSRTHQKKATRDEVEKIHKKLPFKFVFEKLEHRSESSRLSRELLIYIPFLLTFIFVFTLRRPIEETFFTAEGMKSALAEAYLPSFKFPRTFMEITTVEWYEDWLGLVLAELYADQSTRGYNNRTLTFKGQNLLIGGLRLRQQRVHSASCSPNENYWEVDTGPPFTQKDCYAAKISSGSQDKKPFLCPLTAFGCLVDQSAMDTLGLGPEGFVYDGSTGAPVVGLLQNYPAGGYHIDFSFNDTYEVVEAKRKAAIQLGFIDSVATRFVDVSFFVYNPGFRSFLQLKYHLEVPYGGTWMPNTLAFGFEVFVSKSKVALVFEFVLVILILIAVYLLCSDFLVERKRGHLVSFFLNFWNFLELSNLLIFMVVFGLRWRWMGQSSNLDYSSMLRPDFGYPEELESIRENYNLQVQLNGVNTILTFLKILKFVRLNNRMNILTRTLDAVQQNLVGVLVIFFVVVTGFAITGTALYGGLIYEFRTMGDSYSTLLRSLIGDTPYEEMSEAHRVMTLFFYWMFTVLGVFVLLNFLIAIISDGFSDLSKGETRIPLNEAISNGLQNAKDGFCAEDESGLTFLERRSLEFDVHRSIWEKMMSKRIELVDPEAADRGDWSELNAVFLTKEDFFCQIPEEIRSVAAENIAEETWKDVAFEYHHKLLAREGQEAQENEQVIDTEVSQAIRGVRIALTVIDNIRARLSLQFTQIHRLVVEFQNERDKQ